MEQHEHPPSAHHQHSEAYSAAGLSGVGGQMVPHQDQLDLPENNDSDSDESEEKDEDPPDDKIFAEFTKVNRTRVKFKCDFKNAILHINGHDYVIKNL